MEPAVPQGQRISESFRVYEEVDGMVSTVDVPTQAQPAPQDSRPEVVNDFAIVAATVNGSGSQTANLTVIRALFKMGIPVSGKNLFPSNIAGLPTWYTIRVSEQ